MSTHRHLGLTLTIAVVFAAGGTDVLTAQPVEHGTRIRVTSPDYRVHRLVGEFVESGLSLVVEQRNGATDTIPLDQVMLIETSAGQDRLRGALLGVLAGGLVGTMAGVISGSGNRCPDSGCILIDDGPDALDVAGGAALGIMVGGLAGVILAPERWTRVWPPEVAVIPAGLSRGLAVHVTVLLR